MPTGDRSRRTRLRNRILGDDRHLGLWILPLFVMAALLGAVLIGGLAALYYGQQVSDLEETTRRARDNLDEVVTDVEESTQQARRSIRRQVRQARDEFTRTPPVQVPAESGVYAVSADLGGGEVRVGTAFTVFSNESETYLVTAAALVDRDGADAVQVVELFLPNQSVTIRVHGLDRGRDLAVLVAEGGPLPVLPWRPADDAIGVGDVVYAAGIAGSNTPAVVEGSVAGVGPEAVVPDLPLNAFLAGGPLLDGSGRVVAVASLRYAPFGEVEGGLLYAPPIRMVCEALLDCTAADLGQ
ncbi:MAG TPA: serine protease [Egibacteraceae bacterium]|nr:serine protease [Egibacteraceae bacterium]